MVTMEIGGTQNSRDDRMSACRSFGSNCHPCSQSRKVSIGIMVGSSIKSRPKSSQKDEAAMPRAEKTHRKTNFIDDISKAERDKITTKGNQTDLEQNRSPWVSPQSFHLRKPTLEAVDRAKASMVLPAGGSEYGRLNGVNPAPTTYNVQDSANLQSSDENMKKFKKISHRREEGEEGDKSRMKDPSSATAQQLLMSEREVIEDKANKTEDRRQVLRTKLWDILETVSSPNKQVSQAPEVGINNLNPDDNIHKRSETVVKPNQNSDTIESDSQSPDHSVRRALTRSLTRKKAASRVLTNKTRNVPHSIRTKKSLEKNIFSFDEGLVGRGHVPVAGGSPKVNGKKKGRKGSKVEANSICFPANLKGDEVQLAIDMSITTSSKKASLTRNTMRSNKKSHPEKNSEFVDVENGTQENNSFLSSAKKMADQHGNISISTIAHRWVQQEDFPNSPLDNIMDPHADLQSPSFELRAPVEAFSSGSPSEKNHGELGDQNSTDCSFKNVLASKLKNWTKDAGTKSTTGNRRRSYQNYPPENNSEFFDEENVIQDNDSFLLPAEKMADQQGDINNSTIAHKRVQQEDFATSPLKNNKDTHIDLQSSPFEFRTRAKLFSPGSPLGFDHRELGNQSPASCCFKSLLTSKRKNYTTDASIRSYNDAEEAKDSPCIRLEPTMEEKDAEVGNPRSSSEKGDSESSKEGWETEAFSPDIGTARNLENVLHPSKRLRSQENIKFQEFSPVVASPEGFEDNGSQEPPEQSKEDGLAKAITLFALALQRVKSKIKSVTSEKSTEVLISVAEGVHLQLQNAESQFQGDVGKLTSLNKSKRKHIEIEFEEQQEQLKLIYQRFTADVNQHIQAYRSKVEGLQAQEKEFRIFMEKRKGSHREFLKKVEESIQAQLSDAETRIAAVHKSGRDKMLQLKKALAKCLKEGTLS